MILGLFDTEGGRCDFVNHHFVFVLIIFGTLKYFDKLIVHIYISTNFERQRNKLLFLFKFFL